MMTVKMLFIFIGFVIITFCEPEYNIFVLEIPQLVTVYDEYNTHKYEIEKY